MTVAIDRKALEELGRDALIAEARARGVPRPDVMTRIEMVDEILRLSTPNPVERKKVRGLFGVARDLIASVVDKGLHLPDAAAFIRGDVRYEPLRAPQPAVATVTLAEIYGAQGHHDRAVQTLDEVLAKEPELAVARRLRDHFATELERRPRSHVRPPPAPHEEESIAPSDAPGEPEHAEVAATAAEEPELGGPVTAGQSRPGRPGSGEEATGPRPVRDVRSRPAAVAFARTASSSCTVYYDLTDGVETEALVIRVVELRPRPGGAERFAQDLACSCPRGSAVALDLEPGSVVRAAVGVRSDGEFRALTVAVEVVPEDDGAWSVTWVPRRGVDTARLVEMVASLAR